MTPAEFKAKIEVFASREYDTESGHIEADKLMCEVLRQLGYGDGVDLFEHMTKWYA